jgi:hypothetical protein
MLFVSRGVSNTENHQYKIPSVNYGRAPTLQSLRPEINNQLKSIFTHPSSQFQSKFEFECDSNESTLRVVTYNIWTQIEDRYMI